MVRSMLFAARLTLTPAQGTASRLLVFGALFVGGCTSPGNGVAQSDTQELLPDLPETQQSLTDPDAPLPDVSDVETLAARYAAAECARTARCNPRYMAWRYASPAECFMVRTEALLQYFRFEAAAVAVGRKRYDASEHRKCEIAAQTAACELDVEQDPACLASYVGNVSEYQGCDFTSKECVPGLTCVLGDDSASRCGLCKQAPLEGQACDMVTACAPGLFCAFPRDTDPVCVKLASLEGEPCVLIDSDDSCAGELQCIDGAGGPKCARPSLDGASCDSDMSDDACDGDKWLVCSESTCQQRIAVGRGERCDDDLRICEYGDQCVEVDPSVYACRPRIQVGASCSDGLCTRDAYCNDLGLCEAKRAAGAACASTSECVAPLRCLSPGGLPSGTSRTCRTLEWMQCE